MTMKVCTYLEYDTVAELVGRGQLGLIFTHGRRDEAVSEQLLKKGQRQAGGIVRQDVKYEVSRGKKCSSPLSNEGRNTHIMLYKIQAIR